MTIPVKLLAFCAVMSAISGAQAQTYAPRVVGKVDAAGRSAPVSTTCGRTHQSGVSDCTHDRRQSRSRNAKIFEAFWGEDGSEADHVALETGNAQFHDGDRSEMLILRQPSPDELAEVEAEYAKACQAAKVSEGGEATMSSHGKVTSIIAHLRGRSNWQAAAHNRDSSMNSHIQDRSVYFGKTHKKRRSKHVADCPHF